MAIQSPSMNVSPSPKSFGISKTPNVKRKCILEKKKQKPLMKLDKRTIVSDSPYTTNKKSKQLENIINQAIKVAQSPEALCEQSNKQNEPVKLTFDADVYDLGTTVVLAGEGRT